MGPHIPRVCVLCLFVCLFYILYEGVHNIIKQCVFVYVDFENIFMGCPTYPGGAVY